MSNPIRVVLFGIFLVFSSVFLLFFVGATVVSGDYNGGFSGTGSYQYFRPSFSTYYSNDQINTYWPILKDMEDGKCEASTDFLVAIPPAGCEPTVVRSDLLEEQNVPVFCQLDSLQVNPLIDVSSIESINFKGEYPKGVAGISFHPARAALNTYDSLLGSPLMNNIGYLVVVLSRNEVEDKMPEFIEGNLTATIKYDAENAFGTGRAEFLLPSLTDSEWEQKYTDYSFWNGKGFVRVNSFTSDGATIGLYSSENRLIREVFLEEGQTSQEIFFPGYYCKAGLKVRLNELDVAQTKVQLNVGGDTIWVSEGSKFLDNKCSVRSIETLTADTGRVSLSCAGNKNFDLVLKQGLANFSNNLYELGKKIGKDYYLTYVGRIPDVFVSNNSSLGDTTMAIVVKKDVLDEELIRRSSELVVDYSKDSRITLDDFKEGIENNLVNEGASVLFNPGTISGENYIDTLYFLGIGSELIDKSSPFDENFSLMNNSVFELVGGNFNNEKTSSNEVFGELALWEAIHQAEKMGKLESKKTYLKLFLDTYPSSSSSDYAQIELNKLRGYDFSESFNSVYVNSKYTSISLESFDKVGLDEKSVEFNVLPVKIGEGEAYCLDTDYKGKLKSEQYDCSYLLVKKIQKDRVDIEIGLLDNSYQDRESLASLNDARKYIKKSATIYLKGYGAEDSIFFEGNNYFIRSLNIHEEASVSLIPEVENTRTEANFTFKIGIEKRNIKLSPDKTKELLNNLNKTIDRWEDRNNKLGQLVKAWKGACFATSAFMMVSNLASNLNGEAIARQDVMEYYRTKCEGLIPSQFTSRTACYNNLSNEIDQAVEVGVNEIKEWNSLVKPNNTEIIKGSGLFGGDSVNQSALRERVAKECGIPLNLSKHMTLEEMKQYKMYEGLNSSGAIDSEWINHQLERVLEPVRQKIQQEKDLSDLEAIFGEGVGLTDLANGRNLISMKLPPSKISWMNLSQGETAQLVRASDNNIYVVVVSNDYQTNRYDFVKAYNFSKGANKNSLNEKEAVFNELSSYSFVKSSCQNKYNEPKVKFYQSSPSKYLPSIVPFDKENGWYVKVSQGTGGIFSKEVEGYQSSGAVSYYTICNVGENEKEENTLGDDICQSYNINSNVDLFGGCVDMSEREVQQLKNRALNAIQQASQQYGEGQIRIGSGIFDAELIATGSDGLECQDFMSPKDCKVLFNVCDPVVCPSSRCDLGGKYKVANVAQTGIIGSLLLCLPNIREGVFVPICLTGVHAGIDSYVSILKSEQACLEESLETGRSVGICDEITSIHTCEFFWRQMAPMVNVILPKVMEYAYGQAVGARGGAEYLSVQAAWDNMQNSIDFWKNTYATDAYNAFKFRNIQEVGSEFCQANIGTSLPDSSEVIDELLEPESPTQFYAQFDEMELTDVTVPPTSQYKVYYHIFAGNDNGVQYSIYLKNPPQSSYYNSNPYITIKSGYVSRGEQADESLDFSAPAGYKELCVVIDAQTHCGFKKVTTDFSVNYLTDKYAEDQFSNTGIVTENECISASPSVLSLANFNLQSGIGDSLDSDLAMSGITRVCATENPSSGVDESRWKEVGYCGNEKMKCWLDKNSVADQISNVQAIENLNLDDTSQILRNSNELTTASSEETVSILNTLNLKIKNSPVRDFNEIVGGLDNIINGSVFNVYKAQAMYYKVKLYVALMSNDELVQPSINTEETSYINYSEDSSEKKSTTTLEGIKEEIFKINLYSDGVLIQDRADIYTTQSFKVEVNSSCNNIQVEVFKRGGLFRLFIPKKIKSSGYEEIISLNDFEEGKYYIKANCVENGKTIYSKKSIVFNLKQGIQQLTPS